MAIRLDKWLWHARFFRSRGLAAEAVASGRIRVNGTISRKPAHLLRSGDTLTFVLGDRVRLVRMLSAGLRRGPAAEAQALYADLDQSRHGESTSAAPAALE